MKKVIYLLITIISFFVFSFLFNSYNTSKSIELKEIEKRLPNSTEILIPTTITNINKEDAYNIIIDTLDRYNGNIYYTRLDSKSDILKKYVYLNRDTYLEKLTLSEGSHLNMESDNFLASFQSGKKEQVGYIEEFAGDEKIEIYPLKTFLKTNYLFDGYVTVELGDTTPIDIFIADLEKNLGVTGIQTGKGEVPNLETQNYYIYILVIYFIIMILLTYYILKSFKKYAVQKSLGYSEKDIWKNEITSIIMYEILICFCVYFLCSFIYIKKFNVLILPFFVEILLFTIIQAIITLVFCSIPFLLLKIFKISEMIKNKEPFEEILFFNTFVKCILCILLIVSGNSIYNNYNRIKLTLKNSYGKWETTKNYVVIPTINNNYRNYIGSNDFINKQKELFTLFNKENAILADFNEFSPGTREIRKNEIQYSWEGDFATVNPNYLIENNILDKNGNKILINESEKDYILLVPEIYESEENLIINHINRLLDTLPPEERTNKQDIKIYWIKDNQDVFTYAIDVNPNEGNIVKNPLIRVLTENNGNKFDYDRIIAYSSNPFKIKVSNIDNAINDITTKINETGLIFTIDSVSSVYDSIASERKDVYLLLVQTLISMIFIFSILVIIIIQSIYNFINQYRTEISIKKLHGYNHFDKYSIYYNLILISWGIIILLNYIINKEQIKYLIGISSLLFTIELILSIISLKIVEKKIVVKALKKGY